MKRGYTILELLVALSLTAIVCVGLSSMLHASAQAASLGNKVDDAYVTSRTVSDRVRRYVENAYLSKDTADTASYFIAYSQGGQATPDTLVFSTLGVNVASQALDTTDQKTFSDRNEAYGPQGGVSEVSLSLANVGDANGAQGLFLRIQTPADGDYTQGGNEELLIPGITSMLLEFWDGAEWISTWNSQSDTRRLPAAVRMTLGTAQSDTAYQWVIPCTYSDVTTTNPVTQ